VRAGVDHVAGHCAIRRGAPGAPKGEIAKGLYPEPPSLTGAARRRAVLDPEARHQDDGHAALGDA
jgi:hypothetical protein